MKERYDYADITKGIGIILMVVGHTGAPRFITNWIYAFHMRKHPISRLDSRVI